MWPFGPKQPCTNCGQNVRKPKDAGQYLCPHCKCPGPWASPEQVQRWEGARNARLRYADIVKQLVSGGSTAALVPVLKETAPQTWYTETELHQVALQEINRATQSALADNNLSEEEEQRLADLVPALGLTWGDVHAAFPELNDRLLMAYANAGRLPKIESPNLLTKDGEVVHAQFPASLMKEVTLREWRGGSTGVSVPVGGRVRLRFGAIRGRSVPIGTELQVADTGTLWITSKRAVFTGTKKTLEMLYKNLVNLTAYNDGVQMNVTNRQTASLFKVRNGEIVAALINVAAQHEGKPA
jgi:hypothetical protein